MLTPLRWCAGPSALPPLKTGTPLAINGVLKRKFTCQPPEIHFFSWAIQFENALAP